MSNTNENKSKNADLVTATLGGAPKSEAVVESKPLPSYPAVINANALLEAQTKLAEAEAQIAAMNAAAAEADLKIKSLELQEREINIQDLQERLHDRKLKKQSQAAVFLGHGQNLKQDNINRDLKQKACNHRKGGDGAAGVVGGKGDNNSQYCVAKHGMANGDIWVRCLRCGKTWKPPLKSDYKTVEAYEAAKERYTIALDFPTRNHTSSSQQFQWGIVIGADGKQEGGPEYYRERMRNVTL